MFLLNLLARIFNVLRSAATPGQIAAGFILGMGAGLIPSLPVLIFLIFIFVIFNVNVTAGLLAMAVFGLIGYAIDPLSHALGYALLVQIEPLKPLWTALYNAPLVPLTGFNNTAVMGSAVIALVLLVPVYIAVRRGIVTYRVRYKGKVERSKAFRIVQGLNVFQWYLQIKQIGDRLW